MNTLDPARAAACAVMLLLAHPVLAQVYKSVDKDGRVIFSDQPSPGAEQVPLGQTNRIPTVDTAAPPAPEEPTSSGPPYTRIAIVEPVDGATITNPGGNFVVQFVLEPALRDGDTLQLLVDGQPTGTISDASIQLEGMLRGEHTLELVVFDARGRFAARAEPVHITLIRPNPKPRIGG
jgi:hypothetical protein